MQTLNHETRKPDGESVRVILNTTHKYQHLSHLVLYIKKEHMEVEWTEKYSNIYFNKVICPTNNSLMGFAT